MLPRKKGENSNDDNYKENSNDANMVIGKEKKKTVIVLRQKFGGRGYDYNDNEDKNLIGAYMEKNKKEIKMGKRLSFNCGFIYS